MLSRLIKIVLGGRKTSSESEAESSSSGRSHDSCEACHVNRSRFVECEEPKAATIESVENVISPLSPLVGVVDSALFEKTFDKAVDTASAEVSHTVECQTPNADGLEVLEKKYQFQPQWKRNRSKLCR